MNRLSVTLDYVALLLALGVIGWRVVRHRSLRVDHLLLFAIGFAYYVPLSSILAHADVLPAYYANPWRAFDRVPTGRRVAASAWSVLVILSVLGGTFVADRMPPRRRGHSSPPSLRRLRASAAPATFVAAMALAAFLAACAVFRQVLLEGYRSSDPTVIQSQTGRGTLAALAMASALASLMALHAASGPAVTRAERLVARTVGAMAIGIPVLILPIGGNRLYSVTLLLIVAVWYSHTQRNLPRSLVVVGGTLGFVVLVALGSLRIGQLPSSATAAYYASSESAFGGWTRDIYLRSDSPPLPPVAPPTYLARDLINVVPRAVLPNKDALRLDPADAGFRTVSPLGATHISVSMWLNFGYVGSLIVFALLAFGLRRLQLLIVARPASSLTMTYAVLAGAAGLPFFRDAFGISIVRWGLVNGVLIVALIHLATRVVAVGLTPPPSRRRPTTRQTEPLAI